jgi:hypothetical protein
VESYHERFEATLCFGRDRRSPLALSDACGIANVVNPLPVAVEVKSSPCWGREDSQDRKEQRDLDPVAIREQANNLA